MNATIKWAKEQAKTIAAFAGTFIFNMIVSFINGSTPLPTTREEWTQYLLTSIGAAIAAYGVRNKITQKQLDKDPNVVGGIVVDTPVKPPLQNATPPEPTTPSGPYVNPFPDPTL